MTQKTAEPKAPDARDNRLLAMLEPADYQALMREATVIPVKLRTRLHRQEQLVDAVYFPITCMVSLLVTTDGEPQMEMATVGREGVVGGAEILQAQGAMGLHLVQIPGAALRVDAEAFRNLLNRRPAVQKVVYRHLYALTRQILYGAACNRLHRMEERCVRWLLMTHDRAAQDSFPLTQEFLSHMLGVRRATVNLAIGMLKKAGFISYVRGTVTVLDRSGLESAACGCYREIVRLYDSLLPNLSKQKSDESDRPDERMCPLPFRSQ
jgi:CRP-like cAMP-binding protein